MATTEREVLVLLKQIAADVRAIKRAVVPEANGDEPRPSVRKKDPRALYGRE